MHRVVRNPDGVAGRQVYGHAAHSVLPSVLPQAVIRAPRYRRVRRRDEILASFVPMSKRWQRSRKGGEREPRIRPGSEPGTNGL